MSVYIKTEAFDPHRELQQHQTTLAKGKYGALASFIGSARDFNDNRTVQMLTLEHYPGMTEQELERIVARAKQRWDILEALIVHRVGTIDVGEPIVLTAAWAAHRDAAFSACRYMIESLKTDAPFWKKERTQDSEYWISGN